MTRRVWLSMVAIAVGFFPVAVTGQDDPGKATLGKISVAVIYATNGDPAVAGERFKPVGESLETRLRQESQLRFKHYRLLGEDFQPLFRSYENWAQPLKPSDEVLVRFEARSRPTQDSMRLDLELWLSRKKILKTDALVETGRPLLVLGPEWRSGRLIISVGLAAKAEPGQ